MKRFIEKSDLPEFWRLLFWLAVGLSAMLWSILLSSCAVPKNMEQESHMDYSDVLQKMHIRMDSLLYNMDMVRKETSEKLSNLKVENTTTYLSVPDSAGRQYPTVVSKTTANKEEKETQSIYTEISVTMQQLVEEVSGLKQQLNSVISDKEKVMELSWWDLYKDKVYAGTILLLFVFVLIGKLKKGG